MSTGSPPRATLAAGMHLRIALQSVAVLAALAVLAGIVAITGTRLDRASAAVTAAEEPVYLPKAEYLRPMSLGWQNVLADLLWFRAINYFGAHYRSDRTYRWLAHMCELVTDLDPRAEHVYRFGGVILPWEANQADAGIRLLEKAVVQFPDSWLFAYHLGFHYYFFKNDTAKALEHLRRAMALPGAHPAVARLVAGLAAERYGPETTMEFLSGLQDDVDSADIRAVLQEHMQSAQLDQHLQQIGAAAAAYQARTGGYPLTVDTLVDAGLLTAVPADPFGGRYQIDPLTGAVSSTSGRTPSRLYQSQTRERILRGADAKEL